jgi:RES domain-containing protein
VSAIAAKTEADVHPGSSTPLVAYVVVVAIGLFGLAMRATGDYLGNPILIAMRSFEPSGSTTVSFGDNWLGGASATILMVPSVIVPEEYNVLFNPMHPRAKRLHAKVVRQFVYHPRLELPRAFECCQ